MTYTRSAYAALFAMALSACAHASGQPSTTLSNVRVEAYQATGAAAQRERPRADERTRFVARTLTAGGPFVSGLVVADLPSCEVWTRSDERRCDASEFRVQSYDER